MNNLLVSKLTEHQKVLDAFRDLPSDIKKYIQTFYQSSRPVLTCRYCNWGVLPPQWGVHSSCEYCFCCHFVPGTKSNFHC